MDLLSFLSLLESLCPLFYNLFEKKGYGIIGLASKVIHYHTGRWRYHTMEEKNKSENRIEIEEAQIRNETEEEPLTLSEREELEQLRKEKERNMKERLYDKIHISVKTLDRIIFALVALGILVTIMGMMAGN